MQGPPDATDGVDSPSEEQTHPISNPVAAHGAIGPLDPTYAPPIRVQTGDPQTSCLSLDRPYRTMSPTPPPGSLRPIRLPQVPGYELLGELGRGGMGVVYRAKQIRLNRFVALKMLLHAETADLSDVVRFRSEAEAVAAVRHPCVVQVHEFGHFEGKPYFAMEFLSGGTLYNRIKSSAPLEPSFAAELVEKLALAVQAAHAQGIVHRDLKPGNILFDDTGEPRITDFGLAKRVSLQLTQTQAVMGTPAYMSPEQACGRTKFVGPPTDIYALGVILYECLTGKPPFAGSDSIIVLNQVMNDSPRSIRSQVGTVPRDLELICLKCLEKLPGDRYLTASEFAEDLGRFLSGKPVGVRPAGPIERGIKWARRRPTMATVYALSAVVFLVSMIGLGFVGLWQQAVRARDDANNHSRIAEAAKAEVDIQRHEAVEARDQLALNNEELAAKNREIAAARDRVQKSLTDEQAAKDKAIASEKETQDAKRKVEEANGKLETLTYFRNVAFANLESRQGNVLQARKLLNDCPDQRRDWEWWHAYRTAHEEAASGSTNAIAWDIAFTEKNVTTVDELGWITPFDFAVGKGKPKPMTADKSSTYISRLSNDAGRVLTVRRNGDKDGVAIVVSDAKTGQALQSLPADGDFPRSAAFSGDGTKVIVSYTQPLQTVAYDMTTGKRLAIFQGFCPGDQLSLNRDGTRALSILYNLEKKSGEAVLWDTATGEVILKHAPKLGFVVRLALNPDATRAAFGSDSGAISFLDLKTEKSIEVEKAHSGSLLAMTFSPDGKKVASSGDDGIVRIWQAQTGASEQQLRGHTKKVFSLRFDSTGQYVASTDAAQRFFVWALNGTKQAVIRLDPPAQMKGQFVADRAGHRCFSFGENGDAHYWDLKNGKLYPQPAPPESKYTAFAFDPKGTRFAAGTDRGTIHLWDGVGTVAADLKPEPKRTVYSDVKYIVESIAFSADGTRLLVSDGWQLTVFDTKTQERVFSEEMRHVIACIGDDGSSIAASWMNEVTVWDIRAKRSRKCVAPKNDWASSLALSTEANLLAAGSRDWGLVIYDLSKPVEKNPLEPKYLLGGHSAAVQSLGFHPKGHRLASGAEDGTIKVWDTANGHEAISPSIGVREPFRSIFFSNSGNDIIATANKFAPFLLHGGTRQPVIPPRK